jgi:hypothetical protein
MKKIVVAIVVLVAFFLCGCASRMKTVVSVPGTAIKTAVPKLAAGKHIADPDQLLSKRGERRKVEELAANVSASTGINVILILERILPKGLVEEFDFEPNKASVRLIRQYAGVLKEGSQSPIGKPKSLVVYITTLDHGISMSGPAELEKRMTTRMFLAIQSAFFKSRLSAKRGPHKTKRHTPEYIGAINLLKEVSCSINEASPPSP